MADKTQKIPLADVKSAVADVGEATQEFQPADLEAALSAAAKAAADLQPSAIKREGVATRVLSSPPPPPPPRRESLAPSAAERPKFEPPPASGLSPIPDRGTELASGRPSPPAAALSRRPPKPSLAPPPAQRSDGGISSRKATSLGMPALQSPTGPAAAFAANSRPAPPAVSLEPAPGDASESADPSTVRTLPGTLGASRKTAAETAASEPAVVSKTPCEPALSKQAFDVESLFDDKLAPERSVISQAAAKLPVVEATPESVEIPDGYRAPRSSKATTVAPLVAAAALLGVTVVAFARGCGSDDKSVASSTVTSRPANPVHQVAPARPSDSASTVAVAAPAALPTGRIAPSAATGDIPGGRAELAGDNIPGRRAELASGEERINATGRPAVMEAEPPSVVATTDKEAESRTLTASQARPALRGGVVAYRATDLPEVDHKAKGREFFSAGKYREAADAYQRASQQTPSDAGAFAGLGASWLAAGNADRAITAYQRALQLKPETSGFQAALGRAYLQKGDRGRAAAAYRRALELDSNNVAARTGLESLAR